MTPAISVKSHSTPFFQFTSRRQSDLAKKRRLSKTGQLQRVKYRLSYRLFSVWFETLRPETGYPPLPEP